MTGGLNLDGKGSGPDRLRLPEDRKADLVRALEKMLVVDVTVYKSLLDWKYGYFRMELKRAGSEVLPVIPKDVLLIQDCSNSIGEQRIHFAKDGLLRCLAEIGPADRFNIVQFADLSRNCFADWAENTPENMTKARAFVQGMKAEGNTDIFAAMSEQMNVKRTPGRPVVAMLVSDGVPTEGLVASSDIIGEFSKLNHGEMSVFAMGTVQTANKYLLDLLGYCNRGDSLVVSTGRWDIPDAMHKLMKEISRPVLADTQFHFPVDSSSEVYPVLTSNLYLDRGLVMYGRYPRGTTNIVFQATGVAGDVKCDMVFNLDLDDHVKKGERDIMDAWANQKIYYLIGRNARAQSMSTINEIHKTADEYGIRVPYRRQLK